MGERGVQVGGRAVLPGALRPWLGGIAGLGAVVLFGLGVLFAGDSRPGVVDLRVWAVVNGAAPPWLYVAQAMDFLGEPVGAPLLVGATVVGCLLLRRPRAAVLVVLGVGVTVGVAKVLKSLVGRTIHGDNLSFPSGHTAFFTSFALVVALLVAGWLRVGRTVGVPLVLASTLLAAAVMGWAQVVLGAHYPTDVVGGWCTAVAVVPVVAWGVDRVADGRR
ncbi:phosphatase PAP2 family protein [Streptomyces sp. NPDC002463]|uniref:phosphatase PAP2 family protein n=1 Tax=Streptomyces sp. NPDC002463 TaxID=3364645 RepID=UPI00369C1BFE